MTFTGEDAQSGWQTTGDNDVPLEERIHEDACWILENIGVKVNCYSDGTIENPRLREVIDTLDSAGVVIYPRTNVEKEGKHYTSRVHMTRPLIDACISASPTIQEFINTYNIERHSLGGGQRASYVRRDGKQEEPTYDDIERFANLAEKYRIPFMFCPLQGNFVTKEEKDGLTKEEKKGLRVEKNELEPLRRMAKNYSGLHIWNVRSQEGATFAKHFQNRFGGNVLTAHSSVRNPLTFNDVCLETMFDSLDEGLGIYDTSMLLGGKYAPAGIYPLTVQAHAEGLAGLVLAQSYMPGSMYVDGAYPALVSPRHKGDLALGAPALTMTNYLVSRVLNHLDIPHMQSGLTTDAKEFVAPEDYTEEHARRGINRPGEYTNSDTERALDWLWPKNNFVAIRHGMTGFLNNLLEVSEDYMEHNCQYLDHKRQNEPVEDRSNPLPYYLMHPDAKEVMEAAGNGGELRENPEELQERNRTLILEAMYDKNGNFEAMPHTLKNLPDLTSMDYLEF